MLICVLLTLAILLFLLPDRIDAEPVFRPQVDPSQVAGLKKDLASLLALSEKELARLIPNRSGFRFVDCPNCSGGSGGESTVVVGLRTPTGSSASSATCGFQTSYTRKTG